MVVTVPDALSNAMQNDNLNMARMVALPGGIFSTDWHTEIPYNGNKYKSDGLVLEFSEVIREQGIKLHSYTITVTNVSTQVFDRYTSNEFSGSTGTVLRAFMDDDGEMIGGVPLIDYVGTLDQWAVAEDLKGRSELMVKMTSDWSSFNLNAGRFTNPNSQKAVYPNDEFFEFAHEEKSTISWGS